MGEQYLPPLLLAVVLVLHRTLCNLYQIGFSLLVHIYQLQLFLDHQFQVPDVHFSLVLSLFQLGSQSLVDFIAAIFAFVELVPFLPVDVELLLLAADDLLQVELLLVVEDFVALVAGLHAQQHLLLSESHFQQALLFLKFGLQFLTLRLGLVDPVLVLLLENAEFADLFLSRTIDTFILSILSYRTTLCFFNSSYLILTSVKLSCAELY